MVRRARRKSVRKPLADGDGEAHLGAINDLGGEVLAGDLAEKGPCAGRGGMSTLRGQRSTSAARWASRSGRAKFYMRATWMRGRSCEAARLADDPAVPTSKDRRARPSVPDRRATSPREEPQPIVNGKRSRSSPHSPCPRAASINLPPPSTTSNLGSVEISTRSGNNDKKRSDQLQPGAAIR